MAERSADSGMVLELEQAAMKGNSPPSGLSLVDTVYYQGLSYIYGRYRAGFIDRERGGQEKRELLSLLEKEKKRTAFLDKQREQTAQMWKALEAPASDLVFGYREGDQEKMIAAARRMWEALYRMPFPEKGRGNT